MIAGRYSLDREIGRGGMGAVWLGRDEVLGRVVALKRIGAPGADARDVARAEREAQLAARLNHPHVVAVFNFVADPETDTRWLVMEYVEGSTLAQLVRERGALAPDDAAPLLRQAAEALAAAHAAGIAHRDVKPSNILVDHHGQVKLTDFGIARVDTDATLTQTGMVTGSPAYLAPEVAAGQRGDETADVWSLGATAFHLLSGRPPYDVSDNLLGGLYRIVHEDPPRLDDPGWMAPMLEATMVKDPDQRWSMAQVRDYLARAADATVPAAAVPPSAGSSREAAPAATGLQDAARGRSANRAVLGAAGLALAVVLGLLLWWLLPGAGEDGTDGAAGNPTPSRTADAGKQDGPTAAGMKSFIRDYVHAVSSDPDAAWQMLTPKFQRESGGPATYREFWSGVGEPHLLGISADPDTLVVRYRVRFDNFGTGRRPTVLDLVYDDGRYLIDGERTEGFEPAG